MNIEKILTDEFKNKIKEAVNKAEKQSGGEIVTYITENSDKYHFIYWAAGFFSAFLGYSIFTILYIFSYFVYSHTLFFLGILFIFPLIVIGLFYLIKPMRLLLIDKDQKDYYVNLKAKETFLEQEVFNTKDRTGVLIYISLFEKKVVVIGDTIINQKVNKDEWDTVIQTIIDGIKKKSLINGIVSGILLCGAILKENNVKRRIRDKNELSDNIKIGRKK